MKNSCGDTYLYVMKLCSRRGFKFEFLRSIDLKIKVKINVNVGVVKVIVEIVSDIKMFSNRICNILNATSEKTNLPFGEYG